MALVSGVPNIQINTRRLATLLRFNSSRERNARLLGPETRSRSSLEFVMLEVVNMLLAYLYTTELPSLASPSNTNTKGKGVEYSQS